MSREAFCQLTAGDANVLMSMLEEADRPGPFETLLREKLNHANVFFREDVPSNVVTIDTRFSYTINGVGFGPSVLVRNLPGDLPGFALSLWTLRGLALLGLAVGEQIEIRGMGGEADVLSVKRVFFQPEAEARLKHSTPLT
ncbi:conserved hypothetical protein [Agrobacterium tumefaciens str. Kerr 14]|uniref:Nucleoside diphosphate kinase regulator n=1 Tax=Agrobacterium tumefaciens str. Kerr 14 TaxID=1183424 RepID=A0A1S7SDP7_AGRTU|nr:transcription elongation factor GreAB [Agrobacterium tumefaciens]CUX67420.1 conserved hypothetical protein [Agrobacterium tumefaciens str. Kerr 14]